MKKTVKIISTLLLAIMLVTVLAGTVMADGPEDVLGELKNPNYTNQTEITNLGQKIVGIIQIVGVVIAVVVILVIGIKYIMGSAEEKAEYKKTMIPYIVGAILVFAGATIVNVLYNVIMGLNAQ